jgi:esterase/lipase
VDAGFVVFRFDFYGSGESPGTLKDRKWSTAEQNARDAINYIESRGAKKIGLWGRSIGGTVAILCSDIPSIRAFTLATTPVLLREVFLSRFEKVRKLELELEQKGLRLPGTGHFKGEFEINKEFFEEVPSTEARVMKNLACMRRVLVLGTTPDTKVPLSNPATIMNTAKEPKKIWIFEGVDHDYKGVEEKALDLTVSWFKGYLGK